MLSTPSCCSSTLTAFLTHSTFLCSPHSPTECLCATGVLLFWCSLLQNKAPEMMGELYYGLPLERFHSVVHTRHVPRCVMCHRSLSKKDFLGWCWKFAQNGEIHSFISLLSTRQNILKPIPEHDHKQSVSFREYPTCKCLSMMIRKVRAWSSLAN